MKKNQACSAENLGNSYNYKNAEKKYLQLLTQKTNINV